METLQKGEHARQGDIICFSVDEFPPGLLNLVKDKEFKSSQMHTVAEGEVTNHFHVVEGGCKAVAVEDDFESHLVEVTDDEATFTHDEHDSFKLPKGKYMFHRQQEYSPDELKLVAD